ncbi:MAG TPA: hypothetical protein VFZ65_14750 [Planctomycetota bacterium]|nr:hypothetical protein [Planctomycetota bacterium]
MSRPVLAALLLLWAPVAVCAQQGETKPAATQQDPDAAYQELAKAYNKAIADWQTEQRAAVKKAQAAGEAIPAIAMTPPTREFIARAQELAAEYEGKDDAVRFLCFILKNASSERNAVKWAVQTLASDHAMSPAIGLALDHIGNAVRFGAKDPAMQLLDEVAGNHKDADTMAHALVVRGTMRLQAAETDEQRKEAEHDLRQVASVTKNEDLLQQAKDALFEIEHLQIGCTAPDIVAKDVDGVDFKLSDYRGKVVLLDFWGFW